jgi:hypothetical protein
MAAKLRRVLIAARFQASRPDQPTPEEINVIRLAWEDLAAQPRKSRSDSDRVISGSGAHLGMETAYPVRSDTANRTAAVPSR